MHHSMCTAGERRRHLLNDLFLIASKFRGEPGFRAGTASVDVRIGRFEAWNLYDESHDMLIVEATIKFAVSSASASDDNPAAGDSDAPAFKIRLNYNF